MIFSVLDQTDEKAEAAPKNVEKKPLEKSITKKKEPSPATLAHPDETKPQENRDPFKEILTGLEGKMIKDNNVHFVKALCLLNRRCLPKSDPM